MAWVRVPTVSGGPLRFDHVLTMCGRKNYLHLRANLFQRFEDLFAGYAWEVHVKQNQPDLCFVRLEKRDGRSAIFRFEHKKSITPQHCRNSMAQWFIVFHHQNGSHFVTLYLSALCERRPNLR